MNRSSRVSSFNFGGVIRNLKLGDKIINPVLISSKCCLKLFSIIVFVLSMASTAYAQVERAGDISILDIDGDGDVDALTDGLLLVRSMFGATDDALATGVVDLDNCTECDATGINNYISAIKKHDICHVK